MRIGHGARKTFTSWFIDGVRCGRRPQKRARSVELVDTSVAARKLKKVVKACAPYAPKLVEKAE